MCGFRIHGYGYRYGLRDRPECDLLLALGECLGIAGEMQGAFAVEFPEAFLRWVDNRVGLAGAAVKTTNVF